MRSFLLRAYRLLLLLQPKAVRSRYGREMMALVSERASENGSVRFWCREFLDVLATAIRGRRRGLGWILVASAVGHSIRAASVYPKAMMGIGAILLTAAVLLAGALMVRR